MPGGITFTQGLRPAIAMSFGLGVSGLDNIILAEVPDGLVNSSNTAFTTANEYTKLWVYLNGVRMKPGTDYAEDGGNHFHFLYPPTTGDLLIVDYLK